MTMTQTKIINIGIIAALFLSLGAASCGKKRANKVPYNTKKWPISNKGVQATVHNLTGTDSQKTTEAQAKNVPPPQKERQIHRATVHNLNIKDPQKTTEAQAENVPPSQKRETNTSGIGDLEAMKRLITTEEQLVTEGTLRRKSQINQRLNDKNSEELTQLGIAVRDNNLAAIKLLAENGALLKALQNKKNQTLIREAVTENRQSIVQAFINAGAPLDKKDTQRRTLLHLAARQGNQAMVQILTKNKEGVDLLDCEKQTALHLASIKGHLEVVKTLVKRKAALDLKDKNGDTPLHCAIRYKHTEIAQYLIKKGADVNIKDSVKSMAPLHLAIEMGDKRTAQYLIKKGADVNVKSEKCQSLTPLQIAAMKGYLIIVKALINKKAIVDAETKEGLLTPLQYATFYRHRDVMKALIDAKAAINTQDNLGRTPLHMAGFNGDQEAATLLIGAGAQTDIQDKKGRTPKDYVRFGRQSMIRRSIKKAKPRRSL